LNFKLDDTNSNNFFKNLLVLHPLKSVIIKLKNTIFFGSSSICIESFFICIERDSTFDFYNIKKFLIYDPAWKNTFFFNFMITLFEGCKANNFLNKLLDFVSSSLKCNELFFLRFKNCKTLNSYIRNFFIYD
jgi:hypothetical protein